MSELVGDEAVAAAAGVLWEIACDYGVDTDTEEFREDARCALAAAAPFLRRQWETELREKIAAEIWEAEQKCNAVIQADSLNPWLNGRLLGLQHARDIAHGIQAGGQQQ